MAEGTYRYFLQLAFNGAAYCGWQIQKNAPTVQETLQEGMGTILQELVKLIGCGRTDSRVHAKDFYAHFDTDQILNSSFVEKLNRILPRDIWVKQLFQPSAITNHARFHATQRTYEYWICTTRNPFYLNLATYYHRLPLNVERMNAAAARLLQYEDFETFSKINPNLNHYKCQVHEAFWTQQNQELLKFTIRANRFVRGMVRLIVASLVRVGNGRISPEEFEARLAARDRQQAADAAPPDGLYLAHIQYPADTLYPLSGLEAQTDAP